MDSNILGHLLDKGNHSLRFGVVQCFPLRESVNRGHIFSMSQTETATPVAPILVCAVKCFFGEMHALVEKLLSNPWSAPKLINQTLTVPLYFGINDMITRLRTNL